MTELEYIQNCPPEAWSEWIDGEIIVFPPPTYEHASTALFFVALMGGYVDDNSLGKVFTGSYQVRFDALRCRRSPDVIYISSSRSRNAQNNYFNGAPDLLIEIVSADSQSRDYREKFLEYEHVGVREYWIVDPISEKVEAYRLGRNRKYAMIGEQDGKISSTVLSGFYLKPAWLLQERFPKVSALLREMSTRHRSPRYSLKSSPANVR